MGLQREPVETSYRKRKDEAEDVLPSGAPRSTSPPLRADSRIVVPCTWLTGYESSSEYDAAPALFLPFDGVGARHPGMTHDAGALGVGAGIPPGILFRTAYRNKTCCKGPRDKR